MTLPLQHGVKVIGLIGPDFRHSEAVADDLPDHHLQRLAVLLIQPEQQAGEHGEDHHQGGGAGGDAAPEHKKERQAHQERRAEAYDLPFRQAEQHLAFYMGQVLGDGHIGHRSIPPFQSVINPLHDIGHAGDGDRISQHLVAAGVADTPPAALLRPEVREALQTLTFQGCQAAHDQVGVAGDAEVGFAPHASGPGEASAGGAQRSGDLRMHQKGLFVVAVEGGGDVRQHFRVGLPRCHRQHMGLSRFA